MNRRERLLHADEPAAATLHRGRGISPFFLTCEHAGKLIPRALGTLGLDDIDRERHIAWDIGAEAVAQGLSQRLDAPLAIQTYSRLVIDCNRDPGVPTSIVELSEATEIPGNRDLDGASRSARAREIFHPFHDLVSGELDRRQARGQVNILVAVHSFTPTFHDEPRPWHIGLLYNRDGRLAKILRRLLVAEGDLFVGDNQPYSISDETDYTIPVHGEQRGIPHIEFEIRQDLIAEPAGQGAWTARLSRLLSCALEQLQDAGHV